MPFCSNCGSKILEGANFCPQCGAKVKLEKQPEVITPPEESIPVSKPQVHKIDTTYTLLDVNEVFNKSYKIVKVLGRDNDGINYQAIDESSGASRSLKIFYQTYFDNVDKLIGSIVRLSKIKSITHPNVAKVYEVNQTHKPAYIVAEYIEGTPLADIKESNSCFFNEAKVRTIAKQLISAAISIRKAGLAASNLTLNNIILNSEDKVVILSSGISYDVGEENEDIFNMGIVLAKLFSGSVFYETFYNAVKLKEKKFEFISGITTNTNEFLAECLHRNASQRYDSYSDMLKALNSLPLIKPENIYTSEEGDTPTFKDESDLVYPINGFDKYFWVIIIGIVIFITLLMTTNILDTVFGHNKATIKFTGFMPEVLDTTQEFSSIASDNYRQIKPLNPRVKRINRDFTPDRPAERTQVNPSVTIPPPQQIISRTSETSDVPANRTPTQTTNKLSMTEGFIKIPSGTFAYGNLDKNAKDNASLSSFYISKAEVTQREWNLYMNSANSTIKGDQFPVDNVTWFEVIQYCNARSVAEELTPCYTIVGTGDTRIVSCNFRNNGYRLPTEAEWEYAARANGMHPYSGSSKADLIAWYKTNANNRLHQVTNKLANAWGLYDMTGNVSEWCWDWYDVNYPKNMPFINPTGPAFGSIKTIRGGNVDTASGGNLEVIFRAKGIPSKAYPHVGFRLVRTK